MPLVRLSAVLPKPIYYNSISSAHLDFNLISIVSAIGGTITNIGDYTIHTFTTGGTFTVMDGGNIDVLIVAGGGAGGATMGGGGGAGGVIYQSNFSISPGSYSVTVGAGGAAQAGTGNNGGNSIFDTLVAIGGGGGGNGGTNVTGVSGGSGGGTSFQNGTAVAGRHSCRSACPQSDGGFRDWRHGGRRDGCIERSAVGLRNKRPVHQGSWRDHQARNIGTFRACGKGNDRQGRRRDQTVRAAHSQDIAVEGTGRQVARSSCRARAFGGRVCGGLRR